MNTTARIEFFIKSLVGAVYDRPIIAKSRAVIDRPYSSPSEIQTQLPLERALARFVSGKVSEVVVINAERGSRRSRMIQDIRRVYSKLERFAFRDSECLAEIRVKPDRAETLYCPQTEVSLLSGKWVHQQVLNGAAISQR